MTTKIGLEEALKRLDRNDPALKTLDLSKNKIGDLGVWKLAQALENNTTLKTLDLSSNNIGDDDVLGAFMAVAKNTTLKTLDLSKNQIGDVGARALARALGNNTTLKTLDLSSNNIGEEGASLFEGALETNTTLKTLDLSSNNIGDKGASLFADALETNTTLTMLGLDEKSFGDKNTKKRLQELLKRNRTMDDERKALVSAKADAKNKTLTGYDGVKVVAKFQKRKETEGVELKSSEQIAETTVSDSTVEVEIIAEETTRGTDNIRDEEDTQSHGVQMFESGMLEYRTNNQSRISLHLNSSIREVDKNGCTIGTTSASLEECKFVCSHADKDTELVKKFGDSRPSADDSSIAKGTHSYMTTQPDNKYLLKFNAHQVTTPGKAGTNIENFHLMRNDFMLTVELSKSDASGGQDTHHAGGYVDITIEMHTSGKGILKIPGLEYAYCLDEGARMDLTNRYVESLNNGDNFEEKVMPEGFPALEVDANDNSKCIILLRFHQLEGHKEIFYDPWWQWMSNREGRFEVIQKLYDSNSRPVHFGPPFPRKFEEVELRGITSTPVNFGPSFPHVSFEDSIVDVIKEATSDLTRHQNLEKLIFSIAINGYQIKRFTGGEANDGLNLMNLFGKISFLDAVNSWQNDVVFVVAISKPPTPTFETELGIVPIIAPTECKIMISFNDYSAGEDAEELAKFLTRRGYPTFCTRLYCPHNPGSWRDATVAGVAACKYFVVLLTNSWQKSAECQYETEIAINRKARREVTLIPVWYEDFDKKFDRNGGFDSEGKFQEAKFYDIQFQAMQSVYHKSGTWMQNILRQLDGAQEAISSENQNDEQVVIPPNLSILTRTIFWVMAAVAVVYVANESFGCNTTERYFQCSTENELISTGTVQPSIIHYLLQREAAAAPRRHWKPRN